MKLSFDPAKPIYTQIVEGFRLDICSGALKPGSRVAPVRELALGLGVNPNTLQRALMELEREGLLYTERTAGRFVTADEALIARTRDDLLKNLIGEFLKTVEKLGCSREELISLMNGEMENDRTDPCRNRT